MDPIIIICIIGVSCLFLFVVVPLIFSIYYIYRSYREENYKNALRINGRKVEIYDNNEKLVRKYIQGDVEEGTVVNENRKVLTEWNEQEQRVEHRFERIIEEF
jgi:hypothetical protein